MQAVILQHASVVARGLEVAAVLISSMAIFSGAAVTWGVLERRSPKRINELALLGTAAGFLFGIPLTLSAFVVLERS